MVGECQGHPAGEYDPMGQTVYCDGSCDLMQPPDDFDEAAGDYVGEDTACVYACGCIDYHMADCPRMTDRFDGGSRDEGMTKADYIDRMMADDGYHDDHPPDGCE